MATIKLNTNTQKVKVIGRLPGLPETHALHNCRVCLHLERGLKHRLYFIIDENNKVQWIDVCRDFTEFHYKMEYEFSRYYNLDADIFYNQRFADTSNMDDDELYQNEHFIESEKADLTILNNIK